MLNRSAKQPRRHDERQKRQVIVLSLALFILVFGVWLWNAPRIYRLQQTTVKKSDLDFSALTTSAKESWRQASADMAAVLPVVTAEKQQELVLNTELTQEIKSNLEARLVSVPAVSSMDNTWQFSSTVSDADWKTYVSAEAEWQVKYPKGWLWRVNNQQKQVIFLNSADANEMIELQTTESFKPDENFVELNINGQTAFWRTIEDNREMVVIDQYKFVGQGEIFKTLIASFTKLN